LVVPKQEIDHWVDAPPELAAHLFTTAKKVAQAIQLAFPCKKVGLMIAGLEVPHLHIHLTPIDDIEDMSFANQNTQASPEDLDAAAEAIRAEMELLGR
jgi:diadenosine tetraphosphate (Ap4A) HIT family hydrolase